MGAPISKSLFQLPEFKDRIIDNADFLDSALSVIVRSKYQGKSISLDVGDQESTLQIDIKNAHEASLKIRYVVDDDLEAENGRVYVVDCFNFDPSTKSYEGLIYHREVFKKTEHPFWGNLLQKLEQATEKKPPSAKALQKFFNQVIVPLELEIPPEPALEAPPVEEIAEVNIGKDQYLSLKETSKKLQAQTPFDFSRSFLFLKSPDLSNYLPPKEPINFLTRRVATIQLSPSQIAQDQFMESIQDPSSFLPFLAGSAFFRFGKMLSFGFLSELGFSGSFAKVVASGVGVGWEASAFEVVERIRRSQNFENLQEAIFHQMGNFALFHASSALFKQVSSSPVVNHFGAFGTFHGLSEFQRDQVLSVGLEDYSARVFLDLGFYLHSTAAGALVRQILGPEAPFFFAEKERSKKTLPVERITQKIVVEELAPPPTDFVIFKPVVRSVIRLIDGKSEIKGELLEEGRWLFAGAFEVRRDDRLFTIQDLRKVPAPGQTPVSDVDNPNLNPLRVNSNIVRPGDIIYLKDGALVSLGGFVHRFFVFEPGFFEKEFYAKPPEFQREFLSKFSSATDFDLLKNYLRETGFYSADIEIQNLENCLKGSGRVDALSPWVRAKVLAFMESENKGMAPHLPQGFESMLEESHAAFGGSYAEQRYHASIAALRLSVQVQQASQVGEVMHALQETPLQILEGTSRLDAYMALERYQRGQIKANETPRDFGIRQKLADIEEFKFYRKHQEGTLHPAYGQDASLERNCKGLDAVKASILFRLKSIAPVKGSAKKYSYAELEELIHEVLERGKPLETIPTEKSVRESVKGYMQQVIDVAIRLFGDEWRSAPDRNYFTGENFGKISAHEQYLQTRYRFARMLLNEKSGLPIFGEPTAREQGHLVWFAKEKLKLRGDVHFADAQWAIRDHLQKFTPQIQEGLRAANQEERALVMETFFGTQQHRKMGDPYKAFEIVRFLGEVGFYREVGVTLEIVGKRIFTNLSLGDLGSVHPEKSNLFFVLHTHPEEYLNPQGEYMGEIEHQGRTIALDVGDMSKDTRTVLFSHQDVRLFVRHAADIFSVAEREPRLDLSIFYDRQTRVFKNWVQHPHGMAEMKVYLSPTGRAQKVEIQYGVKSEAQGNLKHISQANALRTMHTELFIPVEVDEVNLQRLEGQVPYARR